MIATASSRGILLALALLTTAGMTACSASGIPGSAGRDLGQPTAPAAAATASRPAAVPSATPARPAGVQNLAISSADKSNLTAAYVSRRGISLSDVSGSGPRAGSVYYAYDPATSTYWALAGFEPSATASLQVQVGFQDGGEIGMFRKAGGGSWQAQLGAFPPYCGEATYFPAAVLAAWSMSTPPSGLTC